MAPALHLIPSISPHGSLPFVGLAEALMLDPIVRGWLAGLCSWEPGGCGLAFCPSAKIVWCIDSQGMMQHLLSSFSLWSAGGREEWCWRWRRCWYFMMSCCFRLGNSLGAVFGADFSITGQVLIACERRIFTSHTSKGSKYVILIQFEGAAYWTINECNLKQSMQIPSKAAGDVLV